MGGVCRQATAPADPASGAYLAVVAIAAARAVSICTLANWATNFLAALAFPWVVERFGMAAASWGGFATCHDAAPTPADYKSAPRG